MYNKKPPFEITASILDKIAEIAELVGQVNAAAGLTTNPMLRRTNRIRTIYSSQFLMIYCIMQLVRS